MLRVLVDIVSHEQSLPFLLPLLDLSHRSFLVVLTLDAFDGSGARVGDGKLELLWMLINHVLYQFRLGGRRSGQKSLICLDYIGDIISFMPVVYLARNRGATDDQGFLNVDLGWAQVSRNDCGDTSKAPSLQESH